MKVPPHFTWSCVIMHYASLGTWIMHEPCVIDHPRTQLYRSSQRFDRSFPDHTCPTCLKLCHVCAVVWRVRGVNPPPSPPPPKSPFKNTLSPILPFSKTCRALSADTNHVHVSLNHITHTYTCMHKHTLSLTHMHTYTHNTHVHSKTPSTYIPHIPH